MRAIIGRCAICGNPFRTRRATSAYCSNKCGARGRAEKLPDPVTRFWTKVDKNGPEAIPGSPCWMWHGSVFNYGYGAFGVDKKTHQAHRYSYELNVGPIPDGLLVLHRCDTPLCVRPDHLKVGTQKDNMQDKVLKGRAATGDRNGSRTHPERLAWGDKNWTRQHPERVLRGERNAYSKLTSEQVLEMRSLYRAGNVSHRDLAMMFGISHCTAGRIIKRQSWKHL